MPPSLQFTSGRHIPTQGRSATATSPQDAALTLKTQSVKSDDPNPSSSNIFVPVVPKFDLYQAFPSILSTLDLMRPFEESKDIEGLQSVSRVFSGCLKGILDSMDKLPYKLRLMPAYEVAQYGVVFADSLLQRQLLRLPRAKLFERHDSICRTIQLAELVITNMRTFLRTVERPFIEKKPLPDIPSNSLISNSDPLPCEREYLPLASIVSEILQEEPDLSVQASGKSASRSSETKPPEKGRKSWRARAIQRIIRRRSSPYKKSSSSSGISSSATIVNPSLPSPMPNKSFGTEVQQRSPEPLYIPRQSAIYYLADPYCPEIDVDMPVPTGDTVAIRLDHQGIMKAASLPALVRILTSKESVLDPDFTPTFFICFRLFTTPSLFLEELRKRFDDQPLAELNPAQLRIWTRHAMAVQIRVGKTILMWLDLYWKPDVDCEALEALRAFVLDRLVSVLPEGMTSHILEGLNTVGGEEPICHRARKAKDLEFIYIQSLGAASSNAPFDVVNKPMPSSATLELMAYNTPFGREQFARQLTAHISERFQKVDPEDAITYWHHRKDSIVGELLQEIIAFEQSLCLWVTDTVLERTMQEARCWVLEFWLDVSTRCLRLRNFSGANCILEGVSHGSIRRMKRTVLKIGLSSKLQFRTLNAFLAVQDNYSSYRQALTSTQPTVPLIAPLIRDVISALAVVPTSIGTCNDNENKTLINLNSYRIIMKTVRAMESCLIPYRFDQDNDFQSWLKNQLVKFSPESEVQINETFYKRSSEVETKEPLLKSLDDPWGYTMVRDLGDKNSLRELPLDHSLTPISESSKSIMNILRRS